MNSDELVRRLEDLSTRVARLEGSRAAPTHDDPGLVDRLLARLEGEPDGRASGAEVVYAGAGPWEHGAVAWQIGRTWDDARATSGERSARILSALANATRLRIVAELLGGPATTGDLADLLDQPTAGQLFHHLKELISAGVIHQPVRGTYAIRRRHAVPLLAVLSATADLGGSTDGDEGP